MIERSQVITRAAWLLLANYSQHCTCCHQAVSFHTGAETEKVMARCVVYHQWQRYSTVHCYVL